MVLVLAGTGALLMVGAVVLLARGGHGGARRAPRPGGYAAKAAARDAAATRAALIGAAIAVAGSTIGAGIAVAYTGARRPRGHERAARSCSAGPWWSSALRRASRSTA